MSSHEGARAEDPGRVEARLEALHHDLRRRRRRATGRRPGRRRRAPCTRAARAPARTSPRARRGPRRARSTRARARRARRRVAAAGGADHVRQVGRAPGDLQHDAVGARWRARWPPTARRRPRRPRRPRARSARRPRAARRGRAPPKRTSTRPAPSSQATSRQSASSGSRASASDAPRAAVRVVAARPRTVAVCVGQRVQAHGDRRDQPERAERAREQLRQVIARDVLDHLAAGLGDRAVARARR